MELLNSVVDKFIICEPKIDCQGKERQLIFGPNSARFSKFFDKIEYSVLDLSKVDVSNYRTPLDIGLTYEYASRNYMGIVLNKYAKENDVCLLSDVDELVTKNVVEWYIKTEQTEPVSLELLEFIYYLNNRNTNIDRRICNCIVRHNPNITPQFYRARRESYGVLKNAGWHWNSQGNALDISNKISSYSIQSINRPEINNIPYLQSCINKNIDFTTNLPIKTELHENFPPEVYDLADKYPFLWKE